MNCPKCFESNYVKCGKQRGMQRYKCKTCSKVFQEKKEKYSNEFRLRCIEMYINNVGIRKIAKLQKTSHTLVIHWIKKMAKYIRNIINERSANITKEDIEILEIDELCTYIKKNQNLIREQKNGTEENGLGFGLLWIGTKTKLLILR